MKKRFFPFLLTQLVDITRVKVQEVLQELDSPMDAASYVIYNIRYPFHMGKPDDEHIYNAFHGKWCMKIREDYWQTAEETLTIGWGDCDDTAICYCTLARKWLSEKDVYVVFGLVYTDSILLGGHAWCVSKGIPDDKFRLYESTLDAMPPEFPSVPDITRTVRIDSITYVPWILFNDKEVIDVAKRQDMKEFKLRENIQKYEAIREAWGLETKVTSQFHRLKNKVLRLLGKVLP